MRLFVCLIGGTSVAKPLRNKYIQISPTIQFKISLGSLNKIQTILKSIKSWQYSDPPGFVDLHGLIAIYYNIFLYIPNHSYTCQYITLHSNAIFQEISSKFCMLIYLDHSYTLLYIPIHSYTFQYFPLHSINIFKVRSSKFCMVVYLDHFNNTKEGGSAYEASHQDLTQMFHDKIHRG